MSLDLFLDEEFLWIFIINKALPDEIDGCAGICAYKNFKLALSKK